MSSASIDYDLDPPPLLDSHDRLTCLQQLEQRILWLSSWTIHHANHIRPNHDGLKVGGHQASSASVVTPADRPLLRCPARRGIGLR